MAVEKFSRWLLCWYIYLCKSFSLSLRILSYARLYLCFLAKKQFTYRKGMGIYHHALTKQTDPQKAHANKLNNRRFFIAARKQNLKSDFFLRERERKKISVNFPSSFTSPQLGWNRLNSSVWTLGQKSFYKEKENVFLISTKSYYLDINLSKCRDENKQFEISPTVFRFFSVRTEVKFWYFSHNYHF